MHFEAQTDKLLGRTHSRVSESRAMSPVRRRVRLLSDAIDLSLTGKNEETNMRVGEMQSRNLLLPGLRGPTRINPSAVSG